MKRLLFLSLFISCSHFEQKFEKPSWVTGVRLGEEATRIEHGSKVFYRRIGGSPRLSREASCHQAMALVEYDMKKEFPYTNQIPHKTEVIFYDEEFRDCAVTISVSKNLFVDRRESENTKRSLASEDAFTEDAAVEALRLRTEKAERFALTGLTKLEFEKYTEEKVVVLQGPDLCQRGLLTQAYSIHGSMHVCWRGENILGYCTLRDQQCWTKTP